MFCYKCGNEIGDDSKFCRHCGAKICIQQENDSTSIAANNEQGNGHTSEVPQKRQTAKSLVACLILLIVGIVAVLILGGLPKEPVSDTAVIESIGETVEICETGINEISLTDNDVNEEQEISLAETENVNIELIYMNTENMRPTILETPGIKVRFNKFGYANNKTVFEVNFIVENETDEEIGVVLTDVTVNGFDVSTSTGKTLVKPGHKSNCDSSVWQKNIDKTGESEWNRIEGAVEIRKGYFGDALYSIPVIIEKECWEYEEEYAENNPIEPIVSSDLEEIPEGAIVISSDNLHPALVDEDGVSASVSSYKYANGKTVFEINFSLENKTDEDLRIVLTDVIVDGYDISTSTGSSVVEAGHKAICDSSVWLRDMKEVGINDWVVLKGVVEIREGYWGDAIYEIPVVIYRNAWESAA